MDVVQEAQEIVRGLKRDNRGNIALTTSQIRKFLSAVNVINNRVLAWEAKGAAAEVPLPPELVGEIRYLQVRLAYQAAKDTYGNVRDFMAKAKLVERIKAIGSSQEKYREFARLVEAIVAYHKFEGGRD